MAQNSFGTVETDAAKVDDEEGKPLHGVYQGPPKGLFLELVTDHTEGHGGETAENDDQRYPNTPRLQVKMVKVGVEEADDHIVDRSKEHPRCDGIV